MSYAFGMKTLSATALLGMGLVLAGCKSAPDLTQAQAQSMIQAKYDQAAPVGVTVVVSDLGMRQGAVAKLWDRTKIYPNRIWADFKLTDEGKKAVKLANGGDVIEWRPQSQNDTSYSITVTTAAANHLKAINVGQPQDEMLPGADTAKGVDYTEGVDLTGVPDALQQIAHNPGNQLSTKRHADFALVNGAWTLKGIN
ncbi:MAG TPA: hypothetical protein VL990_11265 [Acidobacteriaceae bacterium]|nr:hypothetical protein [Acidobacteriaceae bacterium]